MNYKTPILFAVLMTMVIACGSGSKALDATDGTYRLDTLISEKSFEIISDMAFPLATNALTSISNAGLLPPGSSAAQINLIGNPNYLRIMGDSISVYLPYYGERQMGGGYTNDGPGIAFEGIPSTMQIDESEEKQRYDIRLRFKDESEQFTLNINLFPNLNSTINVNSSQRFPIRYSGRVRAIPDDSKK